MTHNGSFYYALFCFSILKGFTIPHKVKVCSLFLSKSLNALLHLNYILFVFSYFSEKLQQVHGLIS